MAKSELFRNKAFAFLIRSLGAFPVERGAGDNKAIKTGEDLIKDGEIMTIFLEGGRTKTGELMRPRSGCALVAQQMQVPVIPACITVVGNPKHTFAKRVIHFGEPLTPEELGLTPDGGRRELKLALLDKAISMNWLTVYELKPDEMPAVRTEGSAALPLGWGV